MKHSTFAALSIAVAVVSRSLPSIAAEPVRNAFAHPENLQVLAKDISSGELRRLMVGISLGLGVRCTQCHVGTDGKAFSEFDFASDEKESKGKAREMLRMVEAINTKFVPRVVDSGEEPLKVECVTCHRGQLRPELIQTVLEAELTNHGVKAAVERYRTLRKQYFGSHTSTLAT